MNDKHYNVVNHGNRVSTEFKLAVDSYKNVTFRATVDPTVKTVLCTADKYALDTAKDQISMAKGMEASHIDFLKPGLDAYERRENEFKTLDWMLQDLQSRS